MPNKALCRCGYVLATTLVFLTCGSRASPTVPTTIPLTFARPPVSADDLVIDGIPDDLHAGQTVTALIMRRATGEFVSAFGTWTVDDPAIVTVVPNWVSVFPPMLRAIAPGTTRLTVSAVVYTSPTSSERLSGSRKIVVQPATPVEPQPDFSGRWAGSVYPTACAHQRGDFRLCAEQMPIPSFVLVASQTGAHVTGSLLDVPVSGEVGSDGALRLTGSRTDTGDFPYTITIVGTQLMKDRATLTGTLSEHLELVHPFLGPYTVDLTFALGVVTVATSVKPMPQDFSATLKNARPTRRCDDARNTLHHVNDNPLFWNAPRPRQPRRTDRVSGLCARVAGRSIATCSGMASTGGNAPVARRSVDLRARRWTLRAEALAEADDLRRELERDWWTAVG